ncbi:MAG: heme ABC exporter ATP-binding protein CcmA [Anaerolineales bacterium]|jgi:heme exporter protein A|nr:MAG: heme ABC exporter ATP-binding protein CcmA [Anaerolineales bacterium]
MIEIQGLTKSFGHTHALRGVDLQVAEGEFLTIVGPNGAGKTTFLRILATLLKPTRGFVRINGLDLAPADVEVRRQIGFVSHQPLVYGNLTVAENLRFYGRIYDVPELEQRVETLLSLVGLDGRAHSLARTLSRGMQQRLSVARSIIHEPSIMLLDEPYTGLDQQASRMLRGLLQTVSTQSHTVVMTTHNLEHALKPADRLVILCRGHIVFQAEASTLSLAELREAYWQHTEGDRSLGPS